MKFVRFFLFLAALLCAAGGYAQVGGKSKVLSYRLEAFASAATGDFTPFHIVSNRYGKVP
jgi:hypothetical protein